MLPRKIMGELSEGMIFDIGWAGRITPVLAVPKKVVPTASGRDEIYLRIKV